MRCAVPARTEHLGINREFAFLDAWPCDLRDAAERAIQATRPRIRPDRPAEVDVGQDA
jgi:hypothetical protein